MSPTAREDKVDRDAAEAAFRDVLCGDDRVTNSIGMAFKLIPAGQFQMGTVSGVACDDEVPQHTVRITRPFYLGAYPVTQEEYVAVIGSNPSHFKGDPRRPVEGVSWFDAVGFCNHMSDRGKLPPFYKIVGKRVSILGGSGYRLPTEAEWEYACRAGTTTKWFCGDTEAELEDAAWFERNSEKQTHPVGQKRPNPWNLYDMHGNVFEWCWDWYSRRYYQESPTEDPLGRLRATRRVYRGGSWFCNAWCCRSAMRRSNPPVCSGHGSWIPHGVLGFRVAAFVSDKQDK